MYNTKFKIDNTTVDYNASNTLSIKEKSKGSMYNNLIKGGDVKDNIPCVFVKEVGSINKLIDDFPTKLQ